MSWKTVAYGSGKLDHWECMGLPLARDVQGNETLGLGLPEPLQSRSIPAQVDSTAYTEFPPQNKKAQPRNMLQIATGKLFHREPAQRNDLRGILHTNLFINGVDPVETAAGRLLPTTYQGGTKSLVYEVTEFIEQPAVAGGLASHGIVPYINDFSAVASFAMNITCSPSPELTARLTGGRRGDISGNPRRQLMRRVFDHEIWCQEPDTLSPNPPKDDVSEAF